MRLIMAFYKFIIILLVLEKRRVKREIACTLIILYLSYDLIEVQFLISAKRRSAGYIVQRVLGTNSLGLKRTVKAVSKLAHKSKRSAEIDDLSLDFTSLSKSRDRLRYNSVKNAFGYIIQKRLDIGFSKYSAARGYRISLFVLFSKLVHIL